MCLNVGKDARALLLAQPIIKLGMQMQRTNPFSLLYGVPQLHMSKIAVAATDLEKSRTYSRVFQSHDVAGFSSL